MKNKILPKHVLLMAAGVAFASFLYVNTDACLKATYGLENAAMVKTMASEEEAKESEWKVPEAAVLISLVKFVGKFLPVGKE